MHIENYNYGLSGQPEYEYYLRVDPFKRHRSFGTFGRRPGLYRPDLLKHPIEKKALKKKTENKEEKQASSGKKETAPDPITELVKETLAETSATKQSVSTTGQDTKSGMSPGQKLLTGVLLVGFTIAAFVWTLRDNKRWKKKLKESLNE